MVLFDELDAGSGPPSELPGHELVVFGQDRASGLRAIIAVYSTALGPALGGTRCHPYPSEAAALADVLALSRAMAYKNAVAGLDHGGGKGVIIAEPATDKSPELLRAYGRLVQTLSGRYVTACDVGTYVADMDIVAETCEFVTGRSEANGGAGDSSVLTALGVFLGMQAGAEHRWGAPSLAGRHVGVIGVGKVGRHLVDHLVADGARITATDVAPAARDWLRTHHPGITWADDATVVTQADVDVLAPCALGGAIDDDNIGSVRAEIVCGGANNQLAHDGLDEQLAAQGVLYCPDFVVNACGVIQVADERRGFDFERARAITSRIFDTTRNVLRRADAEGITPTAAAERIAEDRMAAATARDGTLTPSPTRP
ncbi:Glu/Leu/Phe/Val dehydrogenase dimerization domain-containing protein [soil metagenome]